MGFPGGSVIKNLPAKAGDSRDAGLKLRLRRSTGEGNGNPLQYSCLENYMDGEAWWATMGSPRVRHDFSFTFTFILLTWAEGPRKLE